MSQSEDELRRRRMTMDALQRGLQRPRQPMDERLPDGSSVQDLLAKVQRPDNFGGISRGVPLSQSAVTDQVAPAISVPANAGLTLPSPSTPNVNLSGLGPPTPVAPAAPPTSPRIGYSLEGLTGTDRLMQRRRALEEADPESKVTASGEILPPHKTGRLRGLGQGAGIAAAQADPNHPMYALGQILGGGLGGVIHPRNAARASRQLERDQLDADIARGLKLEGMEQDVRGPKWGQMSTRVVSEGEYPGIEAGTEIRVRLDPRTGAVTDVVGPNNKPVIADLGKRGGGAPHYETDTSGNLLTIQDGRARRVTDEDGKPVQVRKGAGGEEYVEVEVNGQKLRVTPGQALGYYGQLGERETKRDEAEAERQRKYSAAKSEYDSLVAAEAEAGRQKDEAFKILDAMRKSGQPKEDVAQAEDAAKAAQAYYQSFGEKKKDAARRMQENEVATANARPYAGRTMSQASLERYAKDKGLNIDEARRQVESQGVRVQ